MGIYRVLKHHHDPDIGLGVFPRLICRVWGHKLYHDNWIQQLDMGGDLAMVSLPALTCGRCLMSMVDESQIEWVKAGYEDNVARAARRAESARFLNEVFNRITDGEELPASDSPVWQEIQDEWEDEE